MIRRRPAHARVAPPRRLWRASRSPTSVAT